MPSVSMEGLWSRRLAHWESRGTKPFHDPDQRAGARVETMIRNDLSVADLVNLAREGDKTAWDELVNRFAPLVWSVCLKFGLVRDDVEEVTQNVWLALVEKLATVREPAALPGWLATTTRRECLHVARARRRREERELYTEVMLAAPGEDDVEADILAEERDHALREAFRQLPPRCQELLELLMAVPRPPYAEIGRLLDMPVGGIGPNRARCLDKLRHNPVLAEWLDEFVESPGVRCAE